MNGELPARGLLARHMSLVAWRVVDVYEVCAGGVKRRALIEER